MGIFMRLVDYAEDTKLHGYSLFPTTLGLLFLGLFLFLKKEWSIHSSTKFPIVGIESSGYFGLVKARARFVSDALQIVKNGYYKYRGKNFVVTTYTHDKIILTHDQVKELSNAPEDIVSMQAASTETMMGTYTGLLEFVGHNYIQEAVRIKLTQNLGNSPPGQTRLERENVLRQLPSGAKTLSRFAAIAVKIVKKEKLPLCADIFSHSKQLYRYLDPEALIKIQTGNIKDAIIEEIRFALDTELPECTTDEWRSIEIFPPLRRTVARTSSRIFVGLPLCRNEDWLNISVKFTRDIFMTIHELTRIRKPFRPFYAWMFNSKKVLNSYKKKAGILLAPTIQSRLEEERLAEKNGSVYEKPNDMLQWLTDLVESQHKNIESLSKLQLLTVFVSISTTSNTFLNAIYDLAAHQECIQPIREEIEAVVSANDGVLDKAALRKMRKTDSFFKESMRKNTGLLGFNRKVMKSLTLSDGTRLPKGAIISAPVAMFSTDPDFIEDPETFDGFRWYKKSLEAEGRSAHSTNWTTTSSSNLIFGHGKHACPGRFFAGEVLKILLTFIILQYDFKYPEGQSRPDSIKRGEHSPPDTTRKLLFKKLPGPKKFSFL